jgi:hypothetical protein
MSSPAGAEGLGADALMWDTLESYHYVRIQPGSEAEIC